MATITLRNSVAYWRIKLRMWFEVTTFAERYGWKPAGTQKPHEYNGEKEWDGDYKLALGQIVSADDASALGRAIRHALVVTSTFVVKDARRSVIQFAEFCEKGKFELLPYGARVRGLRRFPHGK